MKSASIDLQNEYITQLHDIVSFSTKIKLKLIPRLLLLAQLENNILIHFREQLFSRKTNQPRKIQTLPY